MTDFSVTRKLSDKLYIIKTAGHGAYWTLRTLRTDRNCAATGKKLGKGEQHYGPVGNMAYRAMRLHREFVESLPAEPVGKESERDR